MPELPEVETIKRGITPFLTDKTITRIIIRQARLRYPVPPLDELCSGKTILSISRRAKYLLIQLSTGCLLIHLGMSGHLRLVSTDTPAGKHDHIDVLLENETMLRYNDPRRFGLWLFVNAPFQHQLLMHLGPEPLSEEFNAEYLEKQAYKKQQNIKSLIMRNEIVVGVGNIYATESLFLAGLHPLTPAGMLQKIHFDKLVTAIKQVLLAAIHSGGTTLRDFYAADGKPGYFTHNLQVYGRKNLLCYQCRNRIQTLIIAGRSSAFCPICQPAFFSLNNNPAESL